jgi:hypothetical protein
MLLFRFLDIFQTKCLPSYSKKFLLFELSPAEKKYKFALRKRQCCGSGIRCLFDPGSGMNKK